MPVVPFIPMIAQGAGMVAGGIASKKAQKNAMQRSPEEMAALGGATQIGNTTGRLGTSLGNQGQRSMASSANYFQTLLQGNRAAMNQATAGPAGIIGDQYRGAERQLEGMGVRGAGRDVAVANLGRQRAGAIAGLTTGVQPDAAKSLGEIGSQQLGHGATNTGQASTIYRQLLGEGFDNRKYAREEGQKAGAAWGKFAGDITKGFGGLFGGKAPLPSTNPTGGGGVWSGPSITPQRPGDFDWS